MWPWLHGGWDLRSTEGDFHAGWCAGHGYPCDGRHMVIIRKGGNAALCIPGLERRAAGFPMVLIRVWWVLGIGVVRRPGSLCDASPPPFCVLSGHKMASVRRHGGVPALFYGGNIERLSILSPPGLLLLTPSLCLRELHGQLCVVGDIRRLCEALLCPHHRK